MIWTESVTYKQGRSQDLQRSLILEIGPDLIESTRLPENLAQRHSTISINPFKSNLHRRPPISYLESHPQFMLRLENKTKPIVKAVILAGGLGTRISEKPSTDQNQ